MRPFYSRDGRLITPVEHIARFNGKRNASKAKVLLYLDYIEGKYLTAKQLFIKTGVSHAYLLSRLPFWYKIRYVNRKVTTANKGRPTWTYCIADRGRHFVRERIPAERRAEYVKEIIEWGNLKPLLKGV